MRNLNKNKTKFWITTYIGFEEILDESGWKTGEYERIYSELQEIKISTYPSDGAIVSRLFGKDYSCDFVAVSNNVELQKDTLLFKSLQLGDYDNTYDFRVDKISPSLNSFSYGLKARI